MTFLRRLAILFVVVPLVELVLLIQLGRTVGFWPTLALVLITGVSGAMLARLEGLRVLVQVQREVASGRIPGQALLDGLSVLIGGVLLLTPGLLTDLLGFSLLLSGPRNWIQRGVRRRLERAIASGSIRVVSVNPWGRGGWSTWGAGPDGDDRNSGLDPSKGIVVEPDDR